MLYMKACPRCHGDVKLDRDNYGVYAKCLQCGFNRDFTIKRRNMPVMPDEVEEAPVEQPKRRAA